MSTNLNLTVDIEALSNLRRGTFRLDQSQQIRSIEGAVEHVNQRGFIYFWPISGIDLPSLWVAVAGDRPVADAHDDPGHISWRWKDSLLGSRSWYYAKVLRKKATIISMSLAPYFYALSENYGSPDDDYLILYQQGLLTQEAKTIYEVILDNGPMDTVALRKASRLASQENESRFNKALADLQADFKIVPIAVTRAGAWHYAFAYEITARHYPELLEQARFISESDARRTLLKHYFESVGTAQLKDAVRLFGWNPAVIQAEIDSLAVSGILHTDVNHPGFPGKWIALVQVCPQVNRA